MLRRTVALLGLLYLLCIGLTLSAFLLWMGVALLTVRVLRSRYQSSALAVEGDQLPELRKLVERCAALLAVPAPQLYLSADPGNWPVFTVPLPRPTILMSAWWARHLTERELEFFVYHELAHGKLGHRFLLDPINVLENVGAVSWFLATPLEVARYALRPWSRLADFSADRVALACMDGDLETVSRALARVTAGDELCDSVSGPAFLEQARALKGGWALYLHEVTSGKLGNAQRLHMMERFSRTRLFHEEVLGELPPPRSGWLERLPVVGPLLAPAPATARAPSGTAS